jgi:hypothetical protein
MYLEGPELASDERLALARRENGGPEPVGQEVVSRECRPW